MADAQPSVDFANLPLQTALIDNLASLNYQAMTPIQAQSLPVILAGDDVIGQGQTGSGKTAAFGLGILNKLNAKQFKVQSVVICPTRELADQVASELRKLARAIPNIKITTLCGGTPLGPQVASLEHGVHIVVGTPGRIEDHLSRNTLKLNHLHTLVLDEADRMLDMGFQEAIDNIIDRMPTERQTLLFSATFPKKIRSIASRIMQQPEHIQVSEQATDSSISQHFYRVTDHNDDDNNRFTALRLLLQHYQPESAVVFCNMKRDAQAVADDLCDTGVSALALHGDLEQRDRDQTLVRFANKSINVLVATDVAARGLDINDLDLVINYHVAHDPEVHTHRIGRTGRAGKQGRACSLFNEREAYRVATLDSDVDPIKACEALPPITLLKQVPSVPNMTTLMIDGGKKQKLRPGDILGALTSNKGTDAVAGQSVGKIQIFDQVAYVAVERDVAKQALSKLTKGQLKGRSFKALRIKDRIQTSTIERLQSFQAENPYRGKGQTQD